MTTPHWEGYGSLTITPEDESLSTGGCIWWLMECNSCPSQTIVGLVELYEQLLPTQVHMIQKIHTSAKGEVRRRLIRLIRLIRPQRVWLISCQDVVRWPSVSSDFKKLRRQLQRKRHIKIELCVKLIVLRLFHVGRVVQNRRGALSLAWHEWFSSKGREWFTVACSRCRQNLNMKISRRRLADYVKTLHQKACRTSSTITFLHSTNEIIDLWRCRWRCRRQIS